MYKFVYLILRTILVFFVLLSLKVESTFAQAPSCISLFVDENNHDLTEDNKLEILSQYETAISSLENLRQVRNHPKIINEVQKFVYQQKQSFEEMFNDLSVFDVDFIKLQINKIEFLNKLIQESERPINSIDDLLKLYEPKEPQGLLEMIEQENEQNRHLIEHGYLVVTMPHRPHVKVYLSSEIIDLYFKNQNSEKRRIARKFIKALSHGIVGNSSNLSGLTQIGVQNFVYELKIPREIDRLYGFFKNNNLYLVLRTKENNHTGNTIYQQAVRKVESIAKNMGLY